jgi:hypothetical protein
VGYRKVDKKELKDRTKEFASKIIKSVSSLPKTLVAQVN